MLNFENSAQRNQCIPFCIFCKCHIDITKVLIGFPIELIFKPIKTLSLNTLKYQKISENMSRILLEGNIAAGKTTILKQISKINQLKNGTKVKIVKEPVDVWTNSPVGNLLKAANNKEINQTLFQVKPLKNLS